MTSIVDEVIERHWAARLAGIRFAQAGDRSWDRDLLEPEDVFLDRVRSGAAEASHKTVVIRGWIKGLRECGTVSEETRIA